MLKASLQILKNCSCRIKPVCGCFTAAVIYQNPQGSLLFYVVPAGSSLLEIDAFSALQLVFTEDQLQCWQTTTESQSDIDQLDEGVEQLSLEQQGHVSELAESRRRESQLAEEMQLLKLQQQICRNYE